MPSRANSGEDGKLCILTATASPQPLPFAKSMSYSPHLPLNLGNRRPITVSVSQNSVCIQLARSFPRAAIRLGVMTNPALVKGLKSLKTRKQRISQSSAKAVRTVSVEVSHGIKSREAPNYTDTEYITPCPNAATTSARPTNSTSDSLCNSVVAWATAKG